ncbi:MAG: hypothetical protein J7518_13955 [Nocardioidaceae bacterium]|nr:hypothetical protein [Nocardioidaceae bacterium]
MGEDMRIGLLALLLATLLTGCGDGPAPAAKTPVAKTPVAETPTSTPEGDGTLVPSDLPTLSNLPRPDLTVAPKKTTVDVRVHGADLSWPQCPKGLGIPQKRTEGAPLPTAAARFAVIGLTNGPSFVANPCLADQVAWARGRQLAVAAYAVVSYPDAATVRRHRLQGPYDGRTRLGALRNVGYQAALFNLRSLRAAGLPTPVVWVDVEPVTGFDWSADVDANAAVVQGTVRGYRDAGKKVGFYSLASFWQRIVGANLRLGLPEWRPAGPRGQAEALRRCADSWSFQGGTGVLGQWIEDHRDRNVTCPGAVRDLREWFGTFR